MISSQVQEPQRISTSLHMTASSAPLSTASLKTDAAKQAIPTYGAYAQPLPSMSPPAGSVPEMDAQGRLYGMQFSFPSAFRPFYISIPGGAPMAMTIPNASPELYATSIAQSMAPQAISSQNIASQAIPPPHAVLAPSISPHTLQQHQLAQQPSPQHQQLQLQQEQHQQHQQLQHQPLQQHQHQQYQPNSMSGSSPQVHQLHTEESGVAARRDSLPYSTRRSSTQQQTRTSPRMQHSVHDVYPYRHKDPQLSKRTKVSRACDECRRKKTRCDVDPEHEVCTPCARAGVPCTFARAQLKRGPAKKRPSHGTLPLPRIYSSQHTGTDSSAAYRNPVTGKPRSASDVISKGLPPIETLLGYNNGSSGTVLSSSQNQQHRHSVPHVSSPSSSSSDSRFPMLVEVACRQSESPSEESKPKVESPTQASTARPRSPPPQYDAGAHGVSHNALMEYYTYLHPIFPLLPDLVADFDAMLRTAGASKEYIVSALNGNSTNVPFGLGNTSVSVPSVVRESHLIALLFTYLRTLDSAWLGASVAACTAMMTVNGEDRFSETSARLAALVVALDKLHCAVFDTPSLTPECVVRVAQLSSRLVPTLKLLGVATPSGAQQEDDQQQFVSAPRVALAVLGGLAQRKITVDEAKTQLQPLMSQLQRTPLEQFASALSNRQSNNHNN